MALDSLGTDQPDPRTTVIRESGAEGGYEQAGAALASARIIRLTGGTAFSYPLRLKSNRDALMRNYAQLLAATRDGELITPAGEWLLDNHHVVEETYRHLRRDLSERYFRKLPQVEVEGVGPVPATLALAWRYVSLSNSDLHDETLTAMCRGYQGVRDLTIGELWAMPAMLRYVLLENLRRLSDRVVTARQDRKSANRLADRLIAGTLENWQPAEADRLTPPFAAQLVYRLRDGDDGADRGLARLEAELERRGQDSAILLSSEHALQSAGNVTVGNIIRSMRRLDETNWTDWFEGLSRVDAILSEAPDFPLLDRPSRNGYRDAIERIARHSDLGETEVARAAVARAGTDPVGAQLVGSAAADFQRDCGYRAPLRERLVAGWRRTGWLGIAAPHAVLTLAATMLIIGLLPADAPGWLTVVLFLLTLVTASEAAVGLVNLAAARILPVRRLPAYDYKSGVPEEARTLVVIPSIISDYDTVDELVQMLELHYLANPDGAVEFGLVSDWSDSAEEQTETDRDLLAHARQGIDRLAAKYDHDGRRFHLLHRGRIWNETDRVWMGWERKRGKLAELNALLLGTGETTFLDTGPRPRPGVRFVLTLDSDTRLPRGSVATLVGKMMHPVNHAVSDPATGVVTAGHALLQPRVTPSLTTRAEASVFQRIFSVNRGMDPYVFTTSDLYQDLADEGSFTGKGIYDLRAFDTAMSDRIPENAVLSHDLLEGNLARAALVSDVQVVEDFPVRYDVEASRQHRWIRGDWQLLPFLVDPGNGLRMLGRLKMFDNLRRSLVMPAWVLSSVLGVVFLPPEALPYWILALLATLFLTPLVWMQAGVMPSQPGVSAPGHLARIAQDLAEYVSQVLLRLVFMAHQAAMSVDAIARTLWRMTVTRRHLLEWRTARQVQTEDEGSHARWWRYMAASPLIGAGMVALTALLNPGALPFALLLAACWILAPAIARLVSRSLETEDRLNVDPADAATLRRVARMTWRYFEAFVTEDSHHLPPDNFQEDPEPKLAERTSPTNIGLYLLSVLTARDMGWIGHAQALNRITRTLDTLERMERHRGHLFNWYDTRDLKVLEPRYISAVDSGNLAGHLIALASALRQWQASPGTHAQSSLAGIGDTHAVLAERMRHVADDRRTLRPLRRHLEELIAGFARSHATYSAEPQLASVRALSLALIAADILRLATDLHADAGRPETAEVLWWARALRANCDEIVGNVDTDRTPPSDLGRRAGDLSERARKLAFEMDFGLLLNREKRLLSIGYRPREEELDQSCYDLLASEARLASLFAIAKGDVPIEHWVRLGRPVTAIGTSGVLLSWSGSMFEYLMPPLVMHEPAGGLLNASCDMAVGEHMRHGQRLGLPWGVSESAFAARDREMNYQYYAFGVPQLALKRMQLSNHVVAPYATLMAAQFRPRAAVRNLARLDGLGAFGPYGYYDAIDFTPARLPEGRDHMVVRNVMAHHHGMSLVAIANVVMDGIHRTRFHDDPVIKAAELLLQEKAPREIVPVERAAEFEQRDQTLPVEETLGVTADPEGDRPLVALLSNGRLSTMISSTGAGPVRFGASDVIRWRPDPTLDAGGIHLFLRDTESGEWWSATTAPRRAPEERASAVISDHKAEFTKSANGIDSRMEVIVASDTAADGRRLTIRNTGKMPRRIEVTSYAEIVLDKADADLAHPAFSKLFVKTAIRDGGRTITAFRNPRQPGDRVLHFAHLLAGPEDGQTVEAETDRRAFLGRGRDLGRAAAFDTGARLTGAEGFTLDPVCAIRRQVTIAPGKSASLQFWTLVAETSEELDQAILHHRMEDVFAHEEQIAWTMSQVQLRHASVSLEEAALFRRIGAALIWPDPGLAVQDDALREAVGRQDLLWSMGISGDRPIFLLRTDDDADIEIVRKALRMMDYFRNHGLAVDLVILNERQSSYTQDLQSAITSLCDMAARASHLDPAQRAVFPVRRDQISDAAFRCLIAAARVVMHTRNGKLSEQIDRVWAEARRPLPAPPLRTPAPARRTPDFPPEEFRFWNGYGGFSEDGREYVVRMRPGERTPQPWINVIARGDFGFHVSAGGAAFTWSVNSRDYQITPWSNDPVVNRPGEAILIHDPATGAVVSPFAALSEDDCAIHEARHGLGYSRFRVWTDWLEAEATMTLAADAPARLTRLTIRNLRDTRLPLQVLSYAELVLGNNRGRTAPVVRAGPDPETGALLARNSFAMEISDRVTAMTADRPADAVAVARTEVLGRNGRLSRPAALDHWPADPGDTKGDPCLAMRLDLTLDPGGTETVTLVLADSAETEIGAVLHAARAPGAFDRAMEAAAREWGDFTGTLQVDTPDPALNLMVNTWLPYQSLSCRIRARSAFYQASGAFGFRDQLQDTSALILQDPGLARTQILNAAGRQFPEGDVQHWWLPRTGAGVRTMISDDVVWLGHITARYVAMTGDSGILDEPLPFLEGEALEPGQHDAFYTPATSDRIAPLYEHCAQALDLAIRREGPQSLPLMLGGDWNDGMNRVGEEGRGESVWLGWFLLTTLDMFAPLAKARGDAARVTAWQEHRARLLEALEGAGWDGAWYRRAYYDDGTPLGSVESDECRIDSIAQTWSSMSGAGDPARARQALDAVVDRLADRQAGIIRLFTPPFEHTDHEPGYIKGYPPGVRENGGQYTHAATWVVNALGRAGRGTEALEMFNLLNPVSHALDRDAADRYRVEPYVVAADVYGADPRTGRGGWTWYTGSGGWLYRAAVEGILGITLEGGTHVRIDPALPDGWPGFTATLRLGQRERAISVTREAETVRVEMDGLTAAGHLFEL